MFNIATYVAYLLRGLTFVKIHPSPLVHKHRYRFCNICRNAVNKQRMPLKKAFYSGEGWIFNDAEGTATNVAMRDILRQYLLLARE